MVSGYLNKKILELADASVERYKNEKLKKHLEYNRGQIKENNLSLDELKELKSKLI